MASSSLRQLQQQFLRYVAGQGPTDPPAGVHGWPDVYARMYFLRLRDVLAQDYPKLQTVLGERGFDTLVRSYLLSFPPSDPAIQKVGGQLPAYLDQEVTKGTTENVGVDRPWLGDLARLEWARVLVYDRPDDPVMTLAQLRGRSADAFAALPLLPIDALEIFELGWRVDRLWRQIEDGQPWVPPVAERCRVLIWRQQGAAFHRTGRPEEAGVLQLLRAGTTFGAVCERLLDEAEERTDGTAGTDLELTARRSWQIVGDWLQSGLIRAA